MRAGQALTDADRRPWLDALRARIDELLATGEPAVITSSALKKSYRRDLGTERDEVGLVFLEASRAELERRLARRTGHFFDPTLLASQLATLERPRRAATIDADREVDLVVRDVVHAVRSWRV
jgi:gluconokinase